MQLFFHHTAMYIICTSTTPLCIDVCLGIPSKGHPFLKAWLDLIVGNDAK